jgi:hypothetical protein
MEIHYLNTDLDLVGPENLKELTSALNSKDVFLLYEVTQGNDGKWYARFETEHQFHEPNANIAAMLTVIESIDESLQRIWWACDLREFNIGYDCGSEPWAFNQRVSSETINRMAAVGASLQITLYPSVSDDDRLDT